MSRVCTALIAAGLMVLLVAPAAGALSIAQHLLPHQCGSAECNPTPAAAILGAGPDRVLASGIEGGAARVYSEVVFGPKVTITSGPPGSPASRIASGLDGNPWVIGSGSGAIQDVTSHGVVTTYSYPADGMAQPLGLAAGFGAAWVVNGDRVDRIAADGQLTRFALPGTLPLDRAIQIVAGPSESVWFTDYDGTIGQITAAGQILEHSSEAEPLDTLRANPEPTGIAVGPDGALWYTDRGHERIGRMTPDGAVREFPIPRHSPPYDLAGSNPMPEGIVAGPEGEYMYFTDPGDNSIGRVSLSGEVTEYPIPSLAPVGPHDITVMGAQLVFDELGVAALGVVDPGAAPAAAPLATPPSISAIAGSLRTQLKDATALAQAAFLRARRGFTAPFTPLEAGTVVITWIAEPPRAPRTRKRAATPIPVATGEETFDLAEPKPMNVEVTAAGERLLKRLARRSRVTLTVHATFSGYWAGPIDVSAHQQLARAPWH